MKKSAGRRHSFSCGTGVPTKYPIRAPIGWLRPVLELGDSQTKGSLLQSHSGTRDFGPGKIVEKLERLMDGWIGA
jgi:hypothetical protein